MEIPYRFSPYEIWWWIWANADSLPGQNKQGGYKITVATH
jgi:hypothetical protein